MIAQTVPEPGQKAPDFKLKGPGGAFYTLSEHLGESPVVPVIAVRVRQEHGPNSLPGDTERFQPAGQLPRAEAGIQQQAESVGLDQAGVARAAAG